MHFGLQLCSLECTQGFSLIRPSNLGFNPTCPSFKLNLDITGINILTKFQEIEIKTVPSRVYSRFSYDFI